MHKPKAVYIFHSTERDIIKIGVSDNPKRRNCSIRTCHGSNVDIYHLTPPLINWKEMEMKCHDYFADRRKLGEWFDVKPCEAKKYLFSICNLFEVDPIMIYYLNHMDQVKTALKFNLELSEFSQKINEWTNSNPSLLKKDYGVHLKGKPISRKFDYRIKGFYEKVCTNIEKHKERDFYVLKHYFKGEGFREFYFETLEGARDKREVLVSPQNVISEY